MPEREGEREPKISTVKTAANTNCRSGKSWPAGIPVNQSSPGRIYAILLHLTSHLSHKPHRFERIAIPPLAVVLESCRLCPQDVWLGGDHCHGHSVVVVTRTCGHGDRVLDHNLSIVFDGNRTVHALSCWTSSLHAVSHPPHFPPLYPKYRFVCTPGKSNICLLGYEPFSGYHNVHSLKVPLSLKPCQVPLETYFSLTCS